MNPVTACIIWTANVIKDRPDARCAGADFAMDDGPHVVVSLTTGHMQRFDTPVATDADRDGMEAAFIVACGLATALAGVQP